MVWGPHRLTEGTHVTFLCHLLRNLLLALPTQTTSPATPLHPRQPASQAFPHLPVHPAPQVVSQTLSKISTASSPTIFHVPGRPAIPSPPSSQLTSHLFPDLLRLFVGLPLHRRSRPLRLSHAWPFGPAPALAPADLLGPNHATGHSTARHTAPAQHHHTGMRHGTWATTAIRARKGPAGRVRTRPPRTHCVDGPLLLLPRQPSAA